MNHLWTLIFMLLVLVGFCFAGWLDRREAKRREERRAASTKAERTGAERGPS